MTEKLNDHLPTTPDVQTERLAELKRLFPDLFDGEGQLKLDEIKQLTGDEPQCRERYDFSWYGKRNAKQTAYTPTTATLSYDESRSVNPEKADGNLIIEGENLETLKTLLSAYREKIKCIYIDPPYNTGKDFVYSDNYTEDKRAYWEETGGLEKGVKVDTNPETAGRYHSNWLSMMYSRLLLARQLLKDDGVIFVSIDDNEVHNLRRLMDDVFGEDSFINQITVKAKLSAGASGGGEDIKLKKNVEFLLCFCKNKHVFERFNEVFVEKNLFSYIKEYKEEGKSWKYTRVLKSLGKCSHYKDIKDGKGELIKIFKHENVEIIPISELAKAEGVTEEKIYLKYFDKVFRDTNAQSSIRQRVLDATDSDDTFYSIEYVPTSGRQKGKKTTLYYKGKNKDIIAWLSDVAFKNERKLIRREKVGTLWSDFNWNNVSKEGGIQYPNGKKPIAFIQRMLKLCTGNDDYILDFFAGSGSVAHATYVQNLLDGGRRKSISVQLPEIIKAKDKIKYYSSKELEHIHTISSLAIERVKRIVQGYGDNPQPIDTGFKVYQLTKSHFPRTEFKPDPEKTEAENIAVLKEYIVEKEKQLTGLFEATDIQDEVLLKNGFKLNYQLSDASEFKHNKIKRADDGEKQSLLCLDSKLNPETVKQLIKNPQAFICLERALSTDDKWNLRQHLKHEFIAF